jgi:hypothetical protein
MNPSSNLLGSPNEDSTSSGLILGAKWLIFFVGSFFRSL